MRLSTMLLLYIDVRYVHVLHRRMIVIVGVCGQQVHPVLSLMKVMRNVVVLVAVPYCLVLVATLCLRHDAHPSAILNLYPHPLSRELHEPNIRARELRPLSARGSSTLTLLDSRTDHVLGSGPVAVPPSPHCRRGLAPGNSHVVHSG
jgi:hypothetical protein